MVSDFGVGSNKHIPTCTFSPQVSQYLSYPYAASDSPTLDDIINTTDM